MSNFDMGIYQGQFPQKQYAYINTDNPKEYKTFFLQRVIRYQEESDPMEMNANDRYEANKNQWCPFPDAQGHWEEMENDSRWVSGGTHPRDIFQQIQEEVMTDQTDRYLRSLDFVANSSGNKAVRQDTRPLETNIRVGVVYAIRCPDNSDYYRTIFSNEQTSIMSLWKN